MKRLIKKAKYSQAWKSAFKLTHLHHQIYVLLILFDFHDEKERFYSTMLHNDLDVIFYKSKMKEELDEQ